MDRVLFGEAEITAAPFNMWPTGPYPHVDPAWKPLPYDPARARRLLAEAGYPNGFEIRMVNLVLGGAGGLLPDINEAVSGYWEAIGIKVKRETMDFSPPFRQLMVDRTTQGMAYSLWNQGVQLELTPGNLALYSTLGALSYIHDPKIQEYLQQAPTEPDPAKRAAMAKALGQWAIDQRLGIPLFANNGIWGLNSRVVSWDNIRAGALYLNRVYTITLRQ